MSQPFRISGGQVDRSRPLQFTFNGRALQGYEGDTLASALLANGIRMVARSLKLHRPRGIVGIGHEDPGALVEIRQGGLVEPNCRATVVRLREGMEVVPQNCWPSLRFDLGALNGLAGGVLAAGFYNKTFMWPAGAWHFYERIIRRYAGHGQIPRADADAVYDSRFAHADVLIAGGGPAGLSAALAASRTGARVILADDGAAFGGRLLYEPQEIGGRPAADWVRAMQSELAGMANVTLLPAASVVGCYDHGLVAIVQRLADRDPTMRVRECLWKVRAAQIVLATGAVERPMLFADNDRPGIMLASAALGYAMRFGVACGRRAVVVTNNDGGHDHALHLHRAGIEVAAVVDSRSAPTAAPATAAVGITVLAGRGAARALGRSAVRALEVRALSADGRSLAGPARRIDCDLICVAGGWTPLVQLHVQNGGKLSYRSDIGAFAPEPADAAGFRSAGACRGQMRLNECLTDGARAGAAAASAAGFIPLADAAPPPPPPEPEAVSDGGNSWAPGHDLPGKCFVDLQNDVTAADIRLAAREGFTAVEHLKRYTTLGMGTDQGKLSNVNGFGVMAEARGVPPGAVGTTKYRPPYVPVTVATVIARREGMAQRPLRIGPLDDWQLANGAVMTPSEGAWRRPRVYAVAGDQDPVMEEVRRTRSAVGMVDVSTLGKLELHGPGAAELLDRLCINNLSTLAPGRARYWVTLRDDGVVWDDGVVGRLAADHFFLTSSTSQFQALYERIEFHLQTAWRDLRVFVTPVTEHWFAAAVAGPAARSVIAAVSDDIDVAPDAMPHMSIRSGRLAGAPARLVRASFSGELAYEYYVPADHALHVWTRILEVGRAHGLGVYGTEAMGVMRLEKGHIVIGRDADGRTTPDDLGLGGLVSKTKDCLGKRSLALPGFSSGPRRQLVGIVPQDPLQRLPAGAHIVANDWPGAAQQSLGFITSLAHSPTLGTDIALALVTDGRSRLGAGMFASAPLGGEITAVRLVDPVFLDPEGARLHA